jgi:hypothetical protein
MTPVAYVVTIEVDPSVETAWNDWHARVHLPDVLSQPGFRSATRYRDESPCFDGWVRYVCRFDLESRAALGAYLNGRESARLRADHAERWHQVTRVARQILVELEHITAARRAAPAAD